MATAHSFRALVLPKEHGSWSLAFEPVLLGLLVAPSGSGALLAASCVAGFFVRRPLKLTATLASSDPRLPAAHRFAAGFAAAAALLLGALAFVDALSLWPLLFALPFGAAFLWYDLRNEMRETEAELAGSIAFAWVPAAIATLAGWSPAAALSLGAIAIARNVTTILALRACLRANKGLSANFVGTWSGTAVATVTLIALTAFGCVPAVVAVFAIAWFLRAAWLTTLLRPRWPAKRFGQLEAAVGALHLAVIVIAYHVQ